MQLSVLDQSPIPQGATGADAVRNTLDLARMADRLGYTRYWVAEHHGGGALAGASPEVLLGPLGMATQRIRIGSGGVMVPHYSPFKVAESFSLLAGLFPDRVDLGIGRAAGTDPLTTYALQRDRRERMPDDFPDQLSELLAWLDGTIPADHPFARLDPRVGGPDAIPEPWLLGSSVQSAIWAAQLGLPYAFADFINPEGAESAAVYHERFQPGFIDEPRMAVAGWAIAADTAQEAERLASSGRMLFSLLRQGRVVPVPPPETALRYLEQRGSPQGRRMMLGTPDEVRARIEQLAADYSASEVIVVSITHDHEARRRSYELIADAFGLAGSEVEHAQAGHAQG